MTATITADDRFHTGTPGDALECPHCGVVARMAQGATPPFRRLQQERPNQVGVVMTCTDCQSPVFLRLRVRAWREDRVELQLLPPEQESSADRFSLRYLPAPVRNRFREAIACHSHDLWQAFAAMCRETASAVLADVGEPGRLKLYDRVNEVQELGDIDETTFAAVRRIIFETAGSRRYPEPEISRQEAAVLLETMKDLLTQTYVRQARLKQVLQVRQFFAEQTDPTPANPAAPRNVSGF
jgi:hypothetical protein